MVLSWRGGILARLQPCRSHSSSSKGLQKMEANQKRAAREAASVAHKVIASEEATLRRAMARKSSKLLPSSLLEILTDRIHRGQWDAALKVFELLRAQEWYEPYAGTYIKLFEMLGRCKQPEQAAFLYQMMVADGCKPSKEAFTAIISTYTRSNLLKSAFEMLEAMKTTKDCSPDVVTYSLMIKACCDKGLFSRAGELLLEMSNMGIQPNAVTYNTIIDAYGKAGMLKEMEKILLRMMNNCWESCKPDNWTRNAAVRNFGKHGEINKMEEWFEKMIECGAGEADSLTLHSLMSAYGNAQMFDKMQAVLSFIRKYHYEIDSVTYNIMINAYGRAGRITDMEERFKRMKMEGVKPDSITYCTLVNYYGKCGLQCRIQKVLNQVESNNVTPDTALYNSVLDAYRRADDLDNVEKYFDEMKKQNCIPDEFTFNILLGFYHDKGMFDKANHVRIQREKIRQQPFIQPLFTRKAFENT